MLFSTRTRILLLILLAGGGGIFAVAEKPSIGLVDPGDWGDVSDTRIEVITTLWVDNTLPFNLQLTDLEIAYEASMNSVHLAEGTRSGLQIPEGNNTQQLSTDLIQPNIPEWWVSHLQNDEKSRLEVEGELSGSFKGIPLSFDADFSKEIETDMITRIEEGLQSAEGTYQGSTTSNPLEGLTGEVEPKVEIQGVQAEWGEITEQETELLMFFQVHNPNTYPIPTPQFAGEFDMNGVRLAEWTANEVELLNAPSGSTLTPSETRWLEFRVRMQNDNIDEWLTSHIRKTESTDADITFGLGFNIGDITIRIPQRGGVSCGFTFQTGIFVDNQSSASSFQECSVANLDLGNGGSDTSENSGSSGDSGEDNSSDGLSDLGL